MGWIRPENVAFPNVWLKFQAKDVESDNLVEYRVQDLPENRVEDAINYLLEHYLDDEPFTSSKDFREDPEALADVINFWRKHFACRSTLVCFRENSDEIVGINLNAIALECDKNKKFQTKAKRLQELIQTVNFISSQVDVFEKFKVEAYLTAFGLSVSRKYRGRGIATEILRARIPFCQAFGIKISSTVFSSTFAQKSAARVGFKKIFAITREQLVEENPMYYLKNLTVECLLMALEIPEK